MSSAFGLTLSPASKRAPVASGQKDANRAGPRDARYVAARLNGASPTHQPHRQAIPRARPKSTYANRPSRSRVAFLRTMLRFLTIALQILGRKLRSGNR